MFSNHKGGAAAANKSKEAADMMSESKREKNAAKISDMGVNIDEKSSDDSFEKYFSKELDLEEDEVPIVLHELNDSALNYIARESYDKALVLLQKAQAIIEQLNLEKSRADKFLMLTILHNMAMCYQKIGALEECSLYLEGCLMNIVSCFSEDLSDAPEEKLKKLKYECKAHMQVCALLSQLHRHKEALSHAQAAISISHYLAKDFLKVSQYYVKRLQDPSMNIDEHPDFKGINGASTNPTSQRMNGKESQEASNKNIKDKISKQHVDFLYDPQMSLLAKTAIKILPIAEELQKKLVPENLILNESLDDTPSKEFETSNDLNSNKKPNEEDFKTTYDKVDMRNLLGYLNQSDWIWSLNIGNIMQISPLTMQDIYTTSSMEYELSRELVLEKICFLAVSYFCVSTELRFIVQMKEDTSVDPVVKRKESEYFHGKALEVACSFLPSECPLVNHILMSYQKHHAPSSQVIKEGQECDEDLKIIRPLLGIESNKHQPIVRANKNMSMGITPHDASPISYIKHYYSTNKTLIAKFTPKPAPVIAKKLATTTTQTVTAYSKYLNCLTF
jgi:tetratricopeptide (TPR) repeat protein